MLAELFGDAAAAEKVCDGSTLHASCVLSMLVFCTESLAKVNMKVMNSKLRVFHACIVLCSESLAEFNMQVWARFNPHPPFRSGSASHTRLTCQGSQQNPCHTCTCFEQSPWPSPTCKYGLASCNPRAPLRSGSICHTQLTFQESQQNPCQTCTPRSPL